MEISPGKAKPDHASAAQAASGHRALFILPRKILYRRSLLVALLAGMSFLSSAVAAQEERPQITPGERKAARKKDAGPRAVAVLQLASNGKASLVPVAILIDGKFWDATVYKADPVPMALEPGTVYEAERAGSSLGLFTVNSALHSNSVNAPTPWIGTGAWVPAGTETPRTALKAESVPVGVETTDEPPKLARSAPKEAPPATSTPPSSSPQSAPGGSAGQSQPSPNQTSPNQTGSNPTSPSPPAPSSAPAETKPSDAKPANRPKGPESDSGTDEANRPRLRRGKPIAPLPEDEVPGYSKPSAAPSAASPANAGKIVEAAASKPAIQSIPAISDAGGPEPRSFAFEWLKDEEGERRQQMVAMAKQQLRAYLDAQAKASIRPIPSGPQAARHSPASKAPEPILENPQMVAYDLWTTNQPVLIFSAEAHMPPPAGSPPAETNSDLQYYILLVAYPDIYNNLHKLYAAVTDKYHLDVTPRLELIDAVDADGDGRGELLFREISDSGTGWTIYRATADKLWKMFDSLNPQ